MSDFWNWLDGKKTTIGGLVTLIGQVAGPLGLPLDLVTVVGQVGTALLGLGVVHKAVKQVRKDNKKPKA